MKYDEKRTKILYSKIIKKICSLLTGIKKLLFGAYFLYTVGYFIDFFVNKKSLNSIEWIFLTIILFSFYISLMVEKKEMLKNILTYFFVICLVLFFKGDICTNYPIYIIRLQTLINYKIYPFLILFGLNFLLRICSLKKEEKEKIEEVYPERKNDCRYIVDFITNIDCKVNILGVNGEFGSGKSFLIEQAIKGIEKENFEIMKIRCLLLDKEEVYLYIAKNINKILVKNHVFSGHFEKLRDSLIKGIDNKFLGGITNIFMKETNIDDIENFKKSISELNKKIILIFDDIDRVNDVEKIDKILSFISDFSDSNIKIILLYHQKNLEKIDEKYTRNWLEKYIPFTRDLSELSFQKVLKEELNKNKLSEQEFEFLMPSNLRDKNSELFKFNKDFSDITSNTFNFNFNFTPRNIKNTLEEVKVYLNDKMLKLETRLIIAYILLKNLMYEDFYEKINSEMSFEEMFPIKIKLLEIDIMLTLEELDLLKNLVRKKDELNLTNDYFDINKKRIFLNENKYDNHLNRYLKKLKISPFVNKNEIKIKITEIEYLINKNKVIILEESKKNLLIYSLMNYYLYSKSTENKPFERKEAIEGAIRKLKFIGKPEYLSSYRRFYEKFIEVLNEENLEERKKKYDKLLESYYNNSGDFKGVFYFGDIQDEKIMEILDTFDDEKNKIEFLRWILSRENDIITDSCISIFFVGKFKNIELSDFIVEKILKKEYKIVSYRTVEKIRNNLDAILKRQDFPYSSVFGDLSNTKFFEETIKFTKELLKEGGYHYKKVTEINEVKKFIERDTLFLETLKTISEEVSYGNYEEKQDENIKIIVSSSYPETIEKIKEMKSLDEKEREIGKLCKEGYSFRYLEEIYKYIFKDK